MKFRTTLPLLALGGMLTAMSGAQAQNLRIDPSILTRATVTDNARGAGGGGSGDMILEVAPTLDVAKEGGRVSGSANLRWRNRYAVEGNASSRSFLSLDGAGTVEAVDDSLFIDADASIRRDNLSLFEGRQDDDLIGGGTRDDETRTFSLAPRYEFRLGSFAEGQLAYRARWLDTNQQDLSASRVGQWTGSLANPTALGKFGWGANYVSTRTYYDDSSVEDVQRDIGRLTLYYNHSRQLRLRAIAGHESNDFGTGQKDSGSIAGAGFDWSPTPRTSISGTYEDRLFGDGYDLSISHSRPRSDWRLSYVKDLTSTTERYTSSRQYLNRRGFSDELIDALFEEFSLTPEELAALDGADPSGARFLSNAYFVEERMQALVTLRGRRNSLAFSMQVSERERLVEGVEQLTQSDVFSQSDRVRTHSASIAFNHSLTPLSNLNALISRARADRSGATDQRTDRWRFALGYSRELGPQTTVGLRYRHTRVDGRGGAGDYAENAITASLNVGF